MYKIKHILLIIVGLLLVSCASNRPNRVHKQAMTQRTQVTLTLDQHEYKTICKSKLISLPALLINSCNIL